VFINFRNNKQKKETKAKPVVKLAVNADPVKCREFQLDGLLGWKKYDVKEPTALKKDEFKYIEVEDMVNCKLEDFGEELEGVLINPPWGGKKFNVEKFVNLI
jgi:hypothetical protein